jgi:S1-C subfamily serine protease
MRLRLALATVAAAVFCLGAASDPAERLANPAKEAHARDLFKEVRCVVCQSESIDDSDADLAKDLRRLVREQVAAGRSDAQIRDFLVARYGEFVLLKPRFSISHALLWFGPGLLLVLGGAGLLWRVRRPPPPEADFAPPPGAPMSFADIFERVSPAVVSIDVTSRAQAQANPLRGIPGFENFPFGGQGQGQGQGRGDQGDENAPGGAAPGPDGPRGPRQQSSGSGFFVSEDGFIVTNNHVVENAEEIAITLKDGKEYKATVVGRDEGTDLAVIKVDDPKARGTKFPYVSFENAAKPRVGDWVITIGNPFGLGGTATAGIISAYGRDIGDTSFVDYIQIDAPINRGNSGGPSFDIFGRVIGVNSAIFSPSGGSVGIGFAIPADTAEAITRQLMTGGKITRGYIGATIQPFTEEMAETQGLSGTEGAIVADLTPAARPRPAACAAATWSPPSTAWPSRTRPA